MTRKNEIKPDRHLPVCVNTLLLVSRYYLVLLRKEASVARVILYCQNVCFFFVGYKQIIAGHFIGPNF